VYARRPEATRSCQSLQRPNRHCGTLVRVAAGPRPWPFLRAVAPLPAGVGTSPLCANSIGSCTAHAHLLYARCPLARTALRPITCTPQHTHLSPTPSTPSISTADGARTTAALRQLSCNHRGTRVPAVTRHPLGACCRPLATQGDADGLRCPLCTLPPMLLRAQHAQHIALMPGTPSTQRVASW